MPKIDAAYDAFVETRIKNPNTLLDALTARQVNLMHMALGVAGEAGELVDAIKKHTIYNRPLDRANVIEELGDLEFYMSGVRQQLVISRELVLMTNWEKLSKRYAQHYTDEEAALRNDKGESDGN